MQYPQPKYNGDPTIASLANGLGTLGRYGDSYMVHAAEGETVIPAEILDANPELKNQLFWQMRMMGIEDPNRYVVGNNLNSINPITGQPEFFFKKIFKAVKKVFKKALPIIAPIVGNLILPGIGGPIASALGTKLQGGSWGDALKSAAFSYAGSALGSGIMGALNPAAGQTAVGAFGSSLKQGLLSPIQSAANIFSGGAANPLAQGILGAGGPLGTGGFFQSAAGTPQAYGGGIFPKYTPVGGTPLSGLRPSAATWPIKGVSNVNPGSPVQQGAFSNLGPAGSQPMYTGNQQFGPDPNWKAPAGTGGGASVGKSHWVSSAGADASVPATETVSKAVAEAVPGASSLSPAKDGIWSNLGGKLKEIGTSPEFLGPVISGGALGFLAYAMTPEEEAVAETVQGLDANDPKRIAYEQWRTLQDKTSPDARQLYSTWYGAPTQTAQQLATNVGITLEQAQAQPQFKYGLQPSLTAAQGGIMRLQGGGEITGPGTGTSDSIPARLSDGEFVMTADAVQGMGNGSRDLGAARMYDLMSRYERTA